MKLYKNTKVMVQLLDDNTDFFENIAGVLQGNALVSFLICQGYILQMSIDLMKEDGFTLKKV